jgi:hypothetical protein
MGPEGAKLERESLMPFGGGASLCPGRMFARNEVKAFVATMISCCDLRVRVLLTNRFAHVCCCWLVGRSISAINTIAILTLGEPKVNSLSDGRKLRIYLSKLEAKRHLSVERGVGVYPLPNVTLLAGRTRGPTVCADTRVR